MNNKLYKKLWAEEKKITLVSGIISIIGVVLSIVGMGVAVLPNLRQLHFEWVSALASVVIALMAGIFSKVISSNMRKLSTRRRIFLSYQHDLEEFAQQYRDIISSNGALVWLDQEQIKPGDNIRKLVERGIEDSDRFVVLLSKPLSAGVMNEMQIAREKGKTIIPVLLADVDLPREIASLKYIDMRKSTPEALMQLVEATK